MQSSSQLKALRAELASAGYFPEFVADSIELTLDGESVIDWLVHHEPTFNRDEIHRHMTVLVLTPTRLVIGHTDEHPGEPGIGGQPSNGAASTTESLGLGRISTVGLTRVVGSPAEFRPGQRPSEAWLTVSWGLMNRIDLEPADCPDPNCQADHGYTGVLTPDDLVVRMSEAADGADRVARLVSFGVRLQRLTGVGSTVTRGSN